VNTFAVSRQVIAGKRKERKERKKRKEEA